MKKDTAILTVLGGAELIIAISAARVIDRETTYPIYLVLYWAMGVPWLLGSYYVIGRGADNASNRMLVLALAVALRLPFLFTDPTLSDDIFRYIWDGRVQHAGVNPYVYPPDAPELASLRNELYAGINNKDIRTIYPPVMEMVFYGATLISGTVFFMKAVFVLFDLILIAVLMEILHALALNRLRALVYAWSPLVIVEVAGSGHNDVFAVLALFAALWALLRRRDMATLALLALSGLGKIVGFALTPLFARAVRARAFVAMACITLAFTFPYARAGDLAFRGLTQYGLRWRGNDSLFHVLFVITGSLDTAKLIVAVSLVAMVLVLVYWNAEPIRGSYLTVGAILMLMTTVHPWYLLWIAPFLAIYCSPAWLFLCLSVGLSYHSAYLATPGKPWEDVLWVKSLEYVPFYAFGVVATVRAIGRNASARRAFLGLHSPP